MDGAADFRTDTAERPAVPGLPEHLPEPVEAAVPEADLLGTRVAGRRIKDSGQLAADIWSVVNAEPEPMAARFPLYADEVAPVELGPAVVPPPADGWAGDEDPRRWLPVTLVAVVVLLAVFLGAWLLLRGDDADPVATEQSPSPSVSASPSPSPSPKPSPKVAVTAPANPTDVGRFATAKPEHTARPNRDLTGDRVRYVGDNMLDGVPETTWRMPGDGTGDIITFTLHEPTVITELGLINGYAKVDRDGRGGRTNWYTRNRRITEVEWIFDDGSSVIQELIMTRKPQTREIDPVLTSTIRLRLVEVTPPYSRDYTAISDVVILGGRP